MEKFHNRDLEKERNDPVKYQFICRNYMVFYGNDQKEKKVKF